MALSNEAKGLALLAFEGAALSYSAWLPSGMTIRTFADSPLQQRDLAHGLLIGTGFNAILGIGSAVLANNNLPFWAAMLGSLVGWIIYSYFIATAHGQGSMRAQEPANG